MCNLLLFFHSWYILHAIFNESDYRDGLVPDCSISIANALEILQSCTKPSICHFLIDCIQNSWFHLYVHMIWYFFNSLWPSDAMWRHKSGSTLAQVMAPSHYLNQCWLIILGVPWHSLESNFTGRPHELIHSLCLEITLLNYTTSPRGQWVKCVSGGEKMQCQALLTLCMLNFSDWTKTYIYILCHSSILTCHRLLKSFLE